MKSIKAMGVYEVAALLISVFWFVSYLGSMQGPASSSNSPTAPSDPSAKRGVSKFLDVMNSIEDTVEGFAIDAAMRALTAKGQVVAADDAPIYAAATPDGKFLYVANAGTKAVGVSAYMIEGLSGSLMPTVPAGFATTSDSGPRRACRGSRSSLLTPRAARR